MSNDILSRICDDENDTMLNVKMYCKLGDLLSMQNSLSKDNPGRRFWSCPWYRGQDQNLRPVLSFHHEVCIENRSSCLQYILTTNILSFSSSQIRLSITFDIIYHGSTEIWFNQRQIKYRTLWLTKNQIRFEKMRQNWSDKDEKFENSILEMKMKTYSRMDWAYFTFC